MSSVAPSVSRSLPAIESSAPRARAARTLRDWIADGTLPAGQPLPREDELARQIGVSRGTLRSALTMLDEENLFRSNGGRLRIVAPRETASQPAGGLLRDAVAVLTHESRPLEEQHEEGWLGFIVQGALQAAHDAHLHALTLHPNTLNGTALEHLALASPLGVVVSDLMRSGGDVLGWANRLQASRLRVVVYGSAPELGGFDRVASDHAAGCYELTRFLLQAGRRAPLMLWPAVHADAHWFAPRLEGHRRAMREAGLEPLQPVFVPSMPNPQEEGDFEARFQVSTRLLAGHLIEHLPHVDALLCATDRDLFGAAAACRLFGKVPGQDVLLAGYDNYWMECAELAFEPVVPAATVDKRNRLLGRALIDLLLERAKNELPASPQLRLIAPQMVVPA